VFHAEAPRGRLVQVGGPRGRLALGRLVQVGGPKSETARETMAQTGAPPAILNWTGEHEKKNGACVKECRLELEAVGEADRSRAVDTLVAASVCSCIGFS